MGERASADEGDLDTGYWETVTETVTEPATAPLTATSVSVGWNFAIALLTNGSLRAWGFGDDGQLDLPQTRVWPGNSAGRDGNRSLVETRPTRYAKVSAGGSHTCALTNGNAIICWGSNSHGQSNVPASTAAGGGFKDVDAGSRSSCGIESRTDRVRCWGEGPVIDVPSVGTMIERSVQRREWVSCFNGADVPTQGTLGAFTRSDGTTQFAFKPYRIDQIVPVFSFAPDEGALTVSSWYFSSPVSFTVTEQPKALKECRDRFEPRQTSVDVGRVGVRLLPTGHLDLMLRTAAGDVAVPQNHNRIPNPAEPGKWWITDRVTFR